MIIEKYGIKLIRLKESDIELLRLKRNSTLVNNLMHERNIISPEMQQKWFESINTIYNNYFIIEYNNQKIGLVNGKNSNYEKRQSEGGMFLWEQDYFGTLIPSLCSVIMSDFTFLINEFEKNYIKILKSNLNAINYNKKLGYVSTKDYLSDEEIEWYILTKEVYLEKMIKLRTAIKNVTGDKWPLTIDNISFRDDSKSDFELLYKPLPAYLKNIVNLILQREHIPYTLT